MSAPEGIKTRGQATWGQAWDAGELTHAYLIVGDGARLAAEALIARVLCPRHGCGECATCHKLAKQMHPDVHWVARSGKRIGIEQIRGLQRAALYAPLEGQKRFFVIESAEEMSLEAANSALRLLESPPPYVIFLILSRSVNVLPTILSRCQVVRARSDEQTDATGAQLGERREPGAREDELALLKELLAADGPAVPRDVLAEWLMLGPTFRPHHLLDAAPLLAQAPDTKRTSFLQGMGLWLRDLCLLKLLGSEAQNLHYLQQRATLETQARQAVLHQLAEVAAAFERAPADLQSNANAQLLCESLLLKWMSCFRSSL